MENLLFLDLIRGFHLLCVAIGMGSAIYYDLRSLHRVAQPLSVDDLEELRRIHKIVSVACVGLWLSGAALIWFRTQFDLASFSPKLWCKVIVVSVLTVNALALNFFAMPALASRKGARLIDVPVRSLMPLMLCAGISLSCWLLALSLGSSSVLANANWDILLPVLMAGAAIGVGSVMTVMFGARAIVKTAKVPVREG